MTAPVPDSASLDAVAAALAGARHVLAITGAGLSADSGLPTYRGVAGLYAGGLTEEGIPYEEALSGHMLATRPEIAWKHMGRIEAACRGARPNRGHRVLALLQERCRVTVLTQNVDGLHRAAGSRGVIELHGALDRLRCDACGWRQGSVSWQERELPPPCECCGAAARPDVVLFGELLPGPAVRAMESAVSARPDVVLSIGTSSLFPYISAPVWLAARQGACTVEINPTETDVSRAVRHRLRGGAAAVLDALWARIA